MSPPLIAHLIDELPRDGAETLIVDLLRHRRPDCRYVVGCLVRGGPLEEEFARIGVPVVVFGRRWRFDPWLVVRLAAWMRRHRVSVVHTHLFTADAYGRLAAKIAGVPAILSTAHNISNPWKGRLHRWIDRSLARATAGVVGCSQEVTRALRERDRIPADKLIDIPNGIELGRFLDAVDDGVREEFRLPPERILIGIVGRLHPQKGHADLLHALAALPETAREQISCLVIGTGELRDELDRIVDRLGLRRQVILTGSRSDVPRLLAALDIFAMPSRWEGLPIALLEAMAGGNAIVATAVGGIPGVLRDGENGCLVPAGDVPALTRTLSRLIADAGMRRRLGDCARAGAIERYDIRRTAGAYNALHARMLNLPLGANCA